MLLRLCSARARLETGLVSGCERLSKPLIKGLRPFTPGTERAVVVSSPTTRAKSPAGGRAATPSTAVARVCGEKWRRDAENAEVLRKCRSREYRESAGGVERVQGDRCGGIKIGGALQVGLLCPVCPSILPTCSRQSERAPSILVLCLARAHVSS